MSKETLIIDMLQIGSVLEVCVSRHVYGLLCDLYDLCGCVWEGLFDNRSHVVMAAGKAGMVV